MNGNPLTNEQLEAGLARLEQEGLSANTLHQYRGYLGLFQRFLQQAGALGPKSLAQWQQAMVQEGALSNSSINTRISAGNSLLRALGHTDWQLLKRLPEEPRLCAELTRQEYFRLLQMAKQQGREQIYYIIKTICCTGVRVPEPLRGELLQFARRSGICKGPVFRNRNGRPAARSTVWRLLQRLCRDAQVDPQKASPRCLERLYQQTQEEVAATVSTLMEQAYTQQLLQENQRIGWDA